jgi:phosphopantothenoylcysteine decarboxylase
VVRAWDTAGGIDGVRGDLSSSSLVPPRGEGDGGGGGKKKVRRREKKKKKKRIIVAPAMNTAMWMHPVTGRHLRVLEEEWGVDRARGHDGDDEEDEADDEGWFEVLRPVEKTLACGDTGGGAMREWTEIVAVIEERLGLVGGGGGAERG